jgi:tetratricopeptide (TPR) repeat protein
MFVGLILGALPLLQGVEIEKMESAVVQLRSAKTIKSESRGTKGAARVLALDKACAAYDAVVKYWPESGVLTAEAAFRSGEINRSLGRPGAAKGSFEVAFDQGEGSTFAPRAILEIGHIHRRVSEMDKALEYYGRLASIKGVPVRYLNDSREWAGKVHFEIGHWEKALDAFKQWSVNSEGPIEQVKAVDLQLRCLLELKQIDAGRALLAKTMEELTPLSEEPSKEGVRLKRALERMKAPSQFAASGA